MNFNMGSGELNEAWNRKALGSALDGSQGLCCGKLLIINWGVARGHTSRPAFWMDQSGSSRGRGGELAAKGTDRPRCAVPSTSSHPRIVLAGDSSDFIPPFLSSSQRHRRPSEGGPSCLLGSAQPEDGPAQPPFPFK